MKKKLYVVFAVGIFLFSINFVSAKTVTEVFNSKVGDGTIYRPSYSNTWEEVHNAENGEGVAFDYIRAMTGKSNTNHFGLNRSFLPFDTSNIPDNAEITSASLNLYLYEKDNDFNDGNNWVTVVQTSQADPLNGLTVEDYDQCGSVDNPVEGIDVSERKSITNAQPGGYMSFNLNEEGMSWIDKENPLTAEDNTKGTLLGLREGHDFLDTPVLGGASMYSYLKFHSSQSGISTSPYLQVTYTLPNPPTTITDPVILIPGIMGSWQKNNAWLMDPILKTYDALIEAFIGAGYVKDETLFLMPYDWRKDNNETADILKAKISLIKNQTEAQKVDLVAHSMGGLIARSYIQSEDYRDDVDQMIFINTPHRGAPRAYLQYAGGFMPGISGFIMKHVFEKEAESFGYKSLVKYIQEKIPAVQQLLPDYPYLMEKKKNDWVLRVYPENSPTNNFLEGLNAGIQVDLLKERAEVFGVKSYGEEDDTLTAIKVKNYKFKKDGKWENGFPYGYNVGRDDYWQVLGQGDKTVASSSLNFLGEEVGGVTIMNQDHQEIVTTAQTTVLKELTGKTPEEYFSKPWDSFSTMLFVGVKCPVDIQVIDPLGQAVGQNFVTDDEVNEIEGSFYTGADFEGEFVTILAPIKGEYKVKIKGRGEGEYELVMSLLEKDLSESKKQIERGFISQGEEKVITISVDEEVEVVKEDLFAKILSDLERLKSEKEITKKTAYIVLKKDFENAQKKYKKMNQERKDYMKKWRERQIKFFLGISKVHLRFFKMKGWISQEAHDVLKNDIKDILKHLQEA